MSTSAPSPDSSPQQELSGLDLPHTGFSRVVDGALIRIGEITSWIWTLLMLLIIYQVIQRYVFSLGSVALEEMQWHLYAIGFMLALSFAAVRDRHVRVDVLAEHWPRRVRLWVELIGLAGFLIPFAVSIVWFAVPFVITSWNLNEISPAPGGLPYRYVLKSFIVTAFILLALAGLSRLTRVIKALLLKPDTGTGSQS